MRGQEIQKTRLMMYKNPKSKHSLRFRVLIIAGSVRKNTNRIQRSHGSFKLDFLHNVYYILDR